MHKLYTVNENAFNKFSKEMAYWLGFIAADGNISLDKYLRPNRLTVGLSSKDESHLLKLRTFLQSTHPIVKKKIKDGKYETTTLRIASRRLCQKLFNLGIVDKKSLILLWPKIPKKYEADFTRGYFDGDGSLTIRKDTKFPVVVILGTMDILSNIIKIANCKGSIRQHNKSNVFRIYYHGNKSAKGFLDYIYKNSTENTRLSRKFLKYSNLGKESSV